MKKRFWLLAGLLAALISGCSTTSSGSGGGETGSSVEIEIPTYNLSAPSGILEQLAWAGTGGRNDPRGSCNGCSIHWNGDTALLENFESNEPLYLFFYRMNGYDSCGNSTANYAAGYEVQANEEGWLQVEVNGLDDDILLYEIYNAESGILLLGINLGGQYPC